jgi:hypothetical protein
MVLSNYQGRTFHNAGFLVHRYSRPIDGRTARRLDYRNGCYPPTLTPCASPSSRLLASWLTKSNVVNFRHTKQTQHPALQPVQLSREDHSRSPPNLQRVPLHILK